MKRIRRDPRSHASTSSAFSLLRLSLSLVKDYSSLGMYYRAHSMAYSTASSYVSLTTPVYILAVIELFQCDYLVSPSWKFNESGFQGRIPSRPMRWIYY